MNEAAAATRETRALNAKVWKRDAFDWYQEPERATTALLGVERFIGHIWDPACGGGNVLRAAEAAGYRQRVAGTDIVRRVGSWWFRGEHDFLAWVAPPLAQNIIVNPPFYRAKGTEAFIRKALSLAVGKVAVFVGVGFLSGGGRAQGLFAELPPSRVWLITPRVSCPPGEYLAAGNEAEGGSTDWAWLVYDMTAPRAATQLSWLVCKE